MAVAAAWDKEPRRTPGTPGMDGVRITVVDAESGQPVSTPFDLTNKTSIYQDSFWESQ
ncbi:MAG: hypothetical protein ACLU9S_03330 [Oscillospiraceae bacterium]